MSTCENRTSANNEREQADTAEISKEIRALRAELGDSVASRLERILRLLTRSDRSHDIDRLERKARDAANFGLMMGTFFVAIAIALLSLIPTLILESEGQPPARFFASTVLIAGGLFVVAGSARHQALNSALKKTRPETDPALTTEPWSALLSPSYWRWLRRENRMILVVHVIDASLAILLIPLLIAFARAVQAL